MRSRCDWATIALGLRKFMKSNPHTPATPKLNNSHERSTLLMKKEVKIDLMSELPEHEIEALAKCFLPDILDYFNSEEGKKEFEEWKKNRIDKVSDEY